MDEAKLLGERGIGEADMLAHLMSARSAFLLGAELKKRLPDGESQSGGSDWFIVS